MINKKKFNRLSGIYNQIPRIECKGLCHTTCTVIGVSKGEMELMEEASGKKRRDISIFPRNGFICFDCKKKKKPITECKICGYPRKYQKFKSNLCTRCKHVLDRINNSIEWLDKAKNFLNDKVQTSDVDFVVHKVNEA